MLGLLHSGEKNVLATKVKKTENKTQNTTDELYIERITW